MDAVSEILRAHGGLLNERDDHEFDHLEDAAKAACKLGLSVTVPQGFERRHATVRVHGMKLILSFCREGNDPARLPGWLRHKTRKEWTRVYVGLQQSSEWEWDDVFRALERPGFSDGWALRTESGWSRQPPSHVKMFLQHRGMDKKAAEALMGGAVYRSWIVVAKHFQPEYPGGREWNLDGAQLVYDPLPGEHPHWDMILEHLGSSLTPAIKRLPWFAKHDIKTGGQYLAAWVACMFREPFEQLPYLFAYGSENCGKSIFHEAISSLVTKGVVNADRALSGKAGDFNGELARAVLCFVEERNVNERSVHARMKDWVTAKRIAIRAMQRDQFETDNATHWFQAANSADYCPVFSGDTRVVVLAVPDLLPEQEIPKPKLLERLREEAPAFMHTVLRSLELPPPVGRLRLPVVVTDAKRQLQQDNASEHACALAEWLAHAIPNSGDTWSGNSKALREDYAKWAAEAKPEYPVMWPKYGKAIHPIVADAKPYLRQVGISVSDNPGSNQGHLVVFTRTFSRTDS